MVWKVLVSSPDLIRRVYVMVKRLMSCNCQRSLDCPHTQTAKPLSENETVSEAWPHPSHLHVQAAKVLLVECPIRNL